MQLCSKIVALDRTIDSAEDDAVELGAHTDRWVASALVRSLRVLRARELSLESWIDSADETGCRGGVTIPCGPELSMEPTFLEPNADIESDRERHEADHDRQ